MISDVDWDPTAYDNLISDFHIFYDAEADMVHHSTFDDCGIIAIARLPPKAHILSQNISMLMSILIILT
jgi:hypothetical protein